MYENIIEYLNIQQIMVDPELLKQINPYESYTPRQISKLGFIKNNAQNPHDLGFIIRQIARGELKAVNMNKDGSRPTWRVSGQDIIDYLQSH